jgi:hypothetical protein
VPVATFVHRRPEATRETTVDTADDLRTFVSVVRNDAGDCKERQVIVRLDGGEKIKLSFGESLTEEVRPGAHHLFIHNTLMWKNVHFTMEPGEHLEFLVVNSGRWWTWGMAGVLGAAPLFLKVELKDRV